MVKKQQTHTAITPFQVVDILIRRRWIVLIALCVSLSVGLYFSFTLPRVYKANTTILVQPQEVPGSYVKSIISSGFDARISAISQQVLSRSNLEKIIEQYDLFRGTKFENMYFEDKISRLKRMIDVKIHRRDSRRGTGAFSLSFQGGVPGKVKQITNALASFFMDENLKLREAQAIGTSEFINAELGKTRKKLEQLEERLAVYRTRFLGGLPSELNSNLSTLDRLQQQLTDQQSALREAKNALNVYKMEMSYLIETPSIGFGRSRAAYDAPAGAVISPATDGMTLDQAEQDLNRLLLTYTDKHPDVVKLQKTIDKLREKAEKEISIKKNTDSIATAGSDYETSETLTFNETSPRSMSQKMQLDQLTRDVKLITDSIKATELKMQTYQELVANTPKREQELLSLQRDYENIQETYNSLLDRKLEAELAVSMEKKQKGEQFRILDSARLPEKPVSPNMRNLFMFSLAGGIGFSGGIIFLLEFINPPVRREDVIENELGLPVLAFIPVLKKKGYVLQKRLKIVCLFILSVYAGGLIAVFGALNVIGVVRTLSFMGIH